MLPTCGYMRFNFTDNICTRATILLILVKSDTCSSPLLSQDSLHSLVHHCFLYMRHDKEHSALFLLPETAKYSQKENAKTQDQVNSIACLRSFTWTQPVCLL